MSVLKPKLLSTLKDYSKEQFLKDVTAGIIVAIIALPLSIALAIASGVSPEKGLYTAIVAGFFISLLGGSRVQIGGPTGAFMVIVYGIVMEFGVEGLTVATIMAGVMLVIMGFLKMGSVIKYIPYPITTGFTSGIALIIFSSQIKDFFGLPIDSVPAEFLDKWKVYFEHFGSVDIQTLIVGLVSLLIILVWPKVNQKIPGALVALIASSLMVLGLRMDVATIGSKFGALSSELPLPHMPAVTLDMIRQLLVPALTIAILGSVESLLSAVVSDGMIGGKHRSNMELIAQGVANFASGLFGGIPATGAIARTVANIKNGGRTPVSGIVHSITLLLILVLFMPFAKLVPLASLAAILMVVAYNMSEWREFTSLLKAPKSDVAVLLVTFFITVLVDLIKAIEIGIILASILFMKRMSDVTTVSVDSLDASEEGDAESVEALSVLSTDRIQVYEINGPFFFGAADKFLDALNSLGSKTDVLIVRMRNVPAMDATALHAFKRMLDICDRKRITVLLSGTKPQPYTAMNRSGLVERIDSKHFFSSELEAFSFGSELVLKKTIPKI